MTHTLKQFCQGYKQHSACFCFLSLFIYLNLITSCGINKDFYIFEQVILELVKISHALSFYISHFLVSFFFYSFCVLAAFCWFKIFCVYWNIHYALIVTNKRLIISKQSDKKRIILLFKREDFGQEDFGQECRVGQLCACIFPKSHQNCN